MSNLLVLGGTAWLGREVASQALRNGVEVTCLARGEAGAAAEGVRLVPADRSVLGAYDAVSRYDWDAVIDVSWQPAQVAGAVNALGERSAHWTYVSSGSVYAQAGVPGLDEDAPRLPALDAEVATMADYGPAKVRCEDIVVAALGERALLARAGLIGGPGDPSDRFGYWVSRFALAGSGPVLVPDVPDLSTQVIDVRDLARWILGAPSAGTIGAVNAVGEATPLSTVLTVAASVASFSGSVVAATPTWLREHDVEPWSGPRSLPLWLPLPDYAGFGARSEARARAARLTRRRLVETLTDTLADERSRGLDRPRRAGLTRADERELIAQLASSIGDGGIVPVAHAG